MKLSLGLLLRAQPANLVRLAHALKINTDGLSHRTVAELIDQQLNPRKKR